MKRFLQLVKMNEYYIYVYAMYMVKTGLYTGSFFKHETSCKVTFKYFFSNRFLIKEIK